MSVVTDNNVVSMTEWSSSDSPRRSLSNRQAATVQRLLDATEEVLTHQGYDELTVRSVASQAGVAPATAYTYFGSREHLVTELYWRKLLDLPSIKVDKRTSVATRLSNAISEIALLVADNEGLASACTSAMISTDRDVRRIRERVGNAGYERLRAAMADEFDERIAQAALLVLSGITIQTGTSHISYGDVPGLVQQAISMLVKGAS